MWEWSPITTAICETLGAVTASSIGTQVTASGTNTKGSWTSLGTAGFTYEAFEIFATRVSATGGYTVDIGISNDGGSTVSIIAADVCIEGTSGAGVTYFRIRLPLHVPAGSQLYARVQSTGSSAWVQMTITGYSANQGGAPGYSMMMCLTTISSSRPVVTSAHGATNTKDRTELVASSGSAVAAVAVLLTNNAANSMQLVDFECGASGSEEVIASNIVLGGSQTNSNDQWFGVFNRAFASGKRFSVNAQASATTGTLRACVYGFI